MKIHEYQAKEILKEYGILVPSAELAATPEDALFAALRLGPPIMVKAQILAGGRGREGGVKEAASPREAKEIASQLLGKHLTTFQTSAAGLLVEKVLIQKKMVIKKEFYLGITVDREMGCPVIIASPAGGMSIEEIAKEYPKKLHKEYISPLAGPGDYQKNKLASSFGARWFFTPGLADIISKLYRIFEEKDCLLVEINPLVLADDNEFYALDAKINFDDNALFRHPDIKESGLADAPYVKLTGNIGCMVNGAGLAMATMDTIKFFGGEPANFLDVGGSASPEKIKTAFCVIASDPSVKAVFINIFGGIFRCDVLAEGILAAYRENNFKLPLVLRLEGNNASEGLEMLKKGRIKFLKANSLSQGAKKAVKLAKIGGAL